MSGSHKLTCRSSWSRAVKIFSWARSRERTKGRGMVVLVLIASSTWPTTTPISPRSCPLHTHTHTHTHTNLPAGQLPKNQRGSGIDSDTSYGSGGTQESRAEQVVQPLRARAHRCRPGAPLLLVRPSSTVVVAAPTAWGLRGRRVGRSTPSATSLGSRRRPTSRTVLGTPASHVCCSCARSI